MNLSILIAIDNETLCKPNVNMVYNYL